MATPHGSRTLPLSSPGTSQDSNVENELPAARCRVFRVRKPKRRKNKNLAKAQSPPESAQARTSDSFQYSARRSAAVVSMSATDTVEQSARDTQMQGASTARYLHYLERRIKLIDSKVDSFRQELETAINLLSCGIDSCSRKLWKKIFTMRDKDSFSRLGDEEFREGLAWINTKRVEYVKGLNRRRDLLKAQIASSARDIREHTDLLNSKLAPFAEQLKPHIQLLSSKKSTYTRDLRKKMRELYFQLTKFVETFDREFIALDIKL